MTTTTVQAGVLLLLPLLLADKTVLPDLVVLLVLHSHRLEEEGREDHRSHLLEEDRRNRQVHSRHLPLIDQQHHGECQDRCPSRQNQVQRDQDGTHSFDQFHEFSHAS